MLRRSIEQGTICCHMGLSERQPQPRRDDMLLFYTLCNTDWKGRPNHEVKFLGRGTQEELVALMNADVLHLQCDDIAADEYNTRTENGEDLEDGWDLRRTHELMSSLSQQEAAE